MFLVELFQWLKENENNKEITFKIFQEDDVARKTDANRSFNRVTLHLQNGPILIHRRLQPEYNPKVPYLPILKNSQLNKFLSIKDLIRGKKFGIVFNELRQLVSDIDYYLVT